MRILFTHTNLLLSKIIMGVTKEPCSHVAVEFPEWNIVIQSNLLGINIVWADSFREKETIVFELEKNTTAADRQRLESLITKYDGSFYDFGALLFSGLYYWLKPKIKLLPTYKANPWAMPGTFLCTEWVTDVIGQEDSMITPYRLYEKLKATGDWKDVTGT